MHCTHVDAQYAVMANEFHGRGQSVFVFLLIGCVQLQHAFSQGNSLTVPFADLCTGACWHAWTSTEIQL